MGDRSRGFFDVPVAVEAQWMMQLGERFALEGLVAQLQPRIAVEVGTWEGGSLRRIAEHSGHVHAFDIDPRAQPHADALDNVTLHLGDARETLPRVLHDLHTTGRHVDFALVDGLHTYDAVTADATALLDSSACTHTTIVFHDTAHAEVRRALDDLDLPHHPKVGLALLDFVPGFLVKDDPQLTEEIRGRAFNGLGLVVLDPGRDGADATTQTEFVPAPELHAAHAAAAQPKKRRWRR